MSDDQVQQLIEQGTQQLHNIMPGLFKKHTLKRTPMTNKPIKLQAFHSSGATDLLSEQFHRKWMQLPPYGPEDTGTTLFVATQHEGAVNIWQLGPSTLETQNMRVVESLNREKMYNLSDVRITRLASIDQKGSPEIRESPGHRLNSQYVQDNYITPNSTEFINVYILEETSADNSGT